jgi:hypothetical protein
MGKNALPLTLSSRFLTSDFKSQPCATEYFKVACAISETLSRSTGRNGKSSRWSSFSQAADILPAAIPNFRT